MYTARSCVHVHGLSSQLLGVCKRHINICPHTPVADWQWVSQTCAAHALNRMGSRDKSGKHKRRKESRRSKRDSSSSSSSDSGAFAGNVVEDMLLLGMPVYMELHASCV